MLHPYKPHLHWVFRALIRSRLGYFSKVALTEEYRLLVMELLRGKQIDDFLFTRENGEPVRDFRRTWDELVKGRDYRVCCSMIFDVRQFAI